jgi:hypothetical protein
MPIKKADVKNHLAAKLRKRHILQRSTVGQVPAEQSSSDTGDIAATGSSQEPLSPSSEFVLPIPSSDGR